ncbi:Tol-Pal system beta propeller repeat protein TolB [Panacagrimonas sp.]|uniref:Tol-Pal system beta propeller repeat protein TolB n=1 Tax=Panacagrimonas sp. TaxID=2480088 RepID=UPI003B52C012
MRYTIRVLFLLLSLGWAQTALAQLQFEVTGGATGAQPIAIVPFAANEGLMDIAEVVEGDLVRSGLFFALPRTDMLERPSDPKQIDYRNWRAVNMDNVVIGSVRRDPGSDRVSVRFYLYDVLRGEQRLGFEMPPAEPTQLRYTAHQIADLIFENLTGIPGVFNTKITYVASKGFGLDRTYALMVADWDGENPRTIATSREPLMSPQWAPDRRRLAYVGYERGRSSIYIHEIATGKVRKLVSEKGINGSPAWSPDGTQVAVTLSYENNPDIYIIDVGTGVKRRMTTTDGIDTEAAWSPDGQSLVFTSERGGPPQIYQMSVNGGEAKRLTFEGRQNLRASYSPDGKTLALVNLNNSRYRIALLELASGSLRMLSDGPFDEGPSFAPNGAAIIYATQGGKGAELATVSTDGRIRQRLRQSGDVREPAWSPLQR